MSTARLHIEHTALLVIDVQEKLLPAIHEHAAVERQVGVLIDGAGVLGLPVLVTEQYKKGLGETTPAVQSHLSAVQVAARCEKLKFSACIEPVREELIRRQRRMVLVCGIEAHVCVLQTCLDLLDNGFLCAVAVDAIGSRRPADREAAIQRLVQAGVAPTTVESALLELLREAGGERFKAILKLIR